MALVPYYQSERCTLYHGDALRILPQLRIDGDATVVTDPVWPNVPSGMFPDCAPTWTFREAMAVLPECVRRVAVHLGCNSDPRFLTGMPERFAFFRTCWLEYVRPGYLNRLLYTSDMAYLFGEPPPRREGAQVISGFCRLVESKREPNDHPCPRQVFHVAWLVEKWSAPTDTIIDPFCGSGTTAVAALRHGRAFVGCEIDEKFCELSVRRIQEAEQSFALFEQKQPETQAEMFP